MHFANSSDLRNFRVCDGVRRITVCCEVLCAVSVPPRLNWCQVYCCCDTWARACRLEASRGHVSSVAVRHEQSYSEKEGCAATALLLLLLLRALCFCARVCFEVCVWVGEWVCAHACMLQACGCVCMLRARPVWFGGRLPSRAHRASVRQRRGAGAGPRRQKCRSVPTSWVLTSRRCARSIY